MECAYMSEKDFADLIGLPLKYVQKMLRDGKGPEFITIGRYRRIKTVSATQWIDDHTTKSE